MQARSVKSTILYDEAEVGLSARTKSISYTDNDSGTSDEISITFEDRDALWLRDDFIPEKEHDLDVTLHFNDWKRQGDKLLYHCGNFTIDDISYGGRPRQCVIKGVSVPAEEAFQTEQRSKTWENVTLKQVAQEMKERYGMKDLFYWGEEPIISKVEQDQEPDSTFLYKLCEQQGMFIKIYKKALVIFDKKIYEGRECYARYTEKDFDGDYEWNSTLNGTYTGALISYTNPEKKKSKPVEVMVGDGKRLLRLNDKADSEGEAQRIAKAKVNLANEKAVTLTFSTMGDPGLFATYNIEIYGMGRMNGKYFVKKVTHRLSADSGHTMSVSCYRIFDRL